MRFGYLSPQQESVSVSNSRKVVSILIERNSVAGVHN